MPKDDFMTNEMDNRARWAGILIASSLMMLIGGCNTSKPAENAQPGTAAAPAPSSSSLQQQRESAEQQVRPDVGEEQKNAQNQASNSLDQDAITAIADTTKALQDIAANKTKDALADIELATGKINILLARNPATALIPVASEVAIIDTAPRDETQLKHLIEAAILAVDSKNLPVGRLILQGLMSEIRVSTTNLPLASYPEALRDAAKALDQNNTTGASDTLLTALNTLVVVEQAIPLPIIIARTAVADAEQKAKTDKATTQTLLEVARNELNRSKELGYNAVDPEYATLDSEISNLEKQVKAGSDVTSLFARLRAELTDFLHRHKK
jgi:YfdX protein